MGGWSVLISVLVFVAKQGSQPPTQSNSALGIIDAQQREVHLRPTKQPVRARSEIQSRRLAAACVASAALLFATATLVMCSLLFMWSAVLRIFNCSSCCFACRQNIHAANQLSERMCVRARVRAAYVGAVSYLMQIRLKNSLIRRSL